MAASDKTVPSDGIEALADRLGVVARTSPPRVASLAGWLADRPEELAFHSVRSLAALAGSDPNTVVRLARALGFQGFDACRSAAQAALRRQPPDYGARSAALVGRSDTELLDELRAAARANVEAVFSPGHGAALVRVVPALLAARRIHCIGVRSCYALAQYFTYVGSIALPNIAPTPAHPGLILDSLSDCGSEDVVIVITFAHYSAEVLRAASVAVDQGARLLAITDSLASPAARGAWAVLRPPLIGPHVLPPLSGAFHMIEALLALLAARNRDSADRVRDFEERLLRLGAYTAG
ncbi:MAG: MurR/RpiR family transcriptional regulator [Gemmobacter sp.]